MKHGSRRLSELSVFDPCSSVANKRAVRNEAARLSFAPCGGITRIKFKGFGALQRHLSLTGSPA
jgi:hypothetical protein